MESRFLKLATLWTMGVLLPIGMAEARIVKWVDSNGVTHYGDKMPSQDAGRSSAVMNKDGIVVKKNEAFNPNSTEQKESVQKQTAEEMRRDTALLASYSSAEEVDFVRDRNLKMYELSIQNLNTRMEVVNHRLNKNLAQLAQIKANKQPISTAMTQEIASDREQASKIRTEIDRTQKTISEIKKRAEADKARYLELRPRKQTLKDVDAKNKTLAELELWRKGATDKLLEYQRLAVSYKRSNASIPNYVNNGIQSTTEEIARADLEIARAKDALKNSQDNFTKGGR